SKRARNAARASSLSDDNVVPSMTTSPAVGRSSPARRPRSVVLPEPDAPTIATAAPGSTSNVTFSRIDSGSSPLCTILVKPSARMSGCMDLRKTLAHVLAARLFRRNATFSAEAGTVTIAAVRDHEDCTLPARRTFEPRTLESFNPARFDAHAARSSPPTSIVRGADLHRAAIARGRNAGAACARRFHLGG